MAWEQIEAERDEERRRAALARRTMDEIVEAATALPEEVRLPTDFVAAFASDRTLFLKLIDRPLTAEETRGVAHGMAVLLEHNRRLRLLAKDLVERLQAACNVVNSVDNHVCQQVGAIRDVWIAGDQYIDIEED
jgi:hypothetical protein